MRLQKPLVWQFNTNGSKLAVSASCLAVAFSFSIATPSNAQGLNTNSPLIPPMVLAPTKSLDESQTVNPDSQGSLTLTETGELEQATAAIPIAQAPSNPPTSSTPGGDSPASIDFAPVKLPERRNTFDSFKTDSLYLLPARFFLNASCENSLRLETNVYQTSSNNRADMIYRLLPNVTAGYALTRRTRVSSNYFLIRDQYMRNNSTLTRNINSIGFRIDHDIPISEKTTLTASFFARELLITKSPSLSDLLPSLLLVRRVGRSAVVYSSIIGQFRFRDVIGQYQEADQFYSFGGVMRRGAWTFTGDTTVVTNFGKTRLRGGHNNQNIIITLEGARQISRRFPLAAFIRTEPIFNTGANSSTGFAGFNFRVFGGLRVEVSKPAIFPLKIGSNS